MKITGIVLGLLAVAVIFLKLFTYEYYLSDDATCGIAFRSIPALKGWQLLRKDDFVLLADENSFRGEGFYRHTVTWGWIALSVAAWIILARVRASTARRAYHRG